MIWTISLRNIYDGLGPDYWIEAVDNQKRNTIRWHITYTHGLAGIVERMKEIVCLRHPETKELSFVLSNELQDTLACQDPAEARIVLPRTLDA